MADSRTSSRKFTRRMFLLQLADTFNPYMIDKRRQANTRNGLRKQASLTSTVSSMTWWRRYSNPSVASSGRRRTTVRRRCAVGHPRAGLRLPRNDDLRAHHTRRPDGRERSGARSRDTTAGTRRVGRRRRTRSHRSLCGRGLCVDAGAVASGERGGDGCGWGYDEGLGACDIWEGWDAA